jgi:hypothetical protein
MGKRSKGFEKRKSDFYITPKEAVIPLLPFLPSKTKFVNPAAGTGNIITHLEDKGHKCVKAYDLENRGNPRIEQMDTRHMGASAVPKSAQYIIENPPWTRSIMHDMIMSWSAIKPTWLIFQSDWMQNLEARPYLEHCRMILAVGRVSWMGNNVGGMENVSWYLFDQNTSGATVFVNNRVRRE